MAYGLPNQTFLIRPMDIDISLLRVGIFCFHAIKPKNARSDQIVAGEGRFLDRNPPYEGRAAWRVFPDPFVNAKYSRWRFEASRLESEAGPRG